MPEIKTALICEGGAMKAAFAAGVVYGLAEKYNIRKVDIAVGISASAPTVAYYVSGQHEKIKEIWQNELGTGKLINIWNFFKGEPVFDVNYLVDQVFGRKHPLDLDALKNSTTEFFIPFYDLQTDKPAYYHNHEDQKKMNIWEALKAGTAIHRKYLSKRPEHCQLVDYSLIDSHIIDKAIEQGATHFILVANDQNLRLHWTQIIGHKLFWLFQAKGLSEKGKKRLIGYNQFKTKSCDEVLKFSLQENVLLIKPDSDRRISVAMNKNPEIRKAMAIGQAVLDKHADSPMIKVFQQRSYELMY